MRPLAGAPGAAPAPRAVPAPPDDRPRHARRPRQALPLGTVDAEEATPVVRPGRAGAKEGARRDGPSTRAVPARARWSGLAGEDRTGQGRVAPSAAREEGTTHPSRRRSTGASTGAPTWGLGRRAYVTGAPVTELTTARAE